MLTIYKIENKQNGRIYIGSTKKDPKVRWSHHISELNLGEHRNFKLQEDFNLHGLESFIFEVICKCYLRERAFMETKLISELDAYYNIRLNKKEN